VGEGNRVTGVYSPETPGIIHFKTLESTFTKQGLGGLLYADLGGATAAPHTPRVQVSLLGCGPTRSGSTFFFSLFFSFFCSFFPDYLNKNIFQK
jgi:hypothetical protein